MVMYVGQRAGVVFDFVLGQVHVGLLEGRLQRGELVDQDLLGEGGFGDGAGRDAADFQQFRFACLDADAFAGQRPGEDVRPVGAHPDALGAVVEDVLDRAHRR